MNRVTAGPKIILGVCLTAAVAVGAMAATSPPPAAPPPSDQAALIAKGKYLATAGDCVSCHTAPNGPPLAGGLGMDTPFGKIFTPNITPDKQTGIGNFTDAQFYRVMHDGIGGHGQYLYPAMPFPWYTKVTHDDVMAIKAYLFSVAPVHKPDKPNEMAFPFNIREGLVAWRAAFFTEGTFKPDPAKSDQLNRGAYLVQGLGHCGECHNGNNLFGASAAAGRLQGGPIDDWYAPNITGDTLEGVGGWSQDQLATFLKTGAAPAGAGVALGPMMETIHNSLQYLTDDDIQAIAAYLKAVPGKATYQDRPQVAVTRTGGDIYLSYCASCHQQDGKGVPGQIPPLAGSGAVKAKEADNVIRVVLGGLPATKNYAPMPALGSGMTDQQIADVANYIRTAWGNGAPATAEAGTVGKLRGETHTLMAVNGLNGCPTNLTPSDIQKAIAGPDGQFGSQLKGITDANLLETVDAMVPKLKAAAPHAKTADLVDGMTEAYCPILLNDKGLTEPQRAARLGAFAEILYGQLVRTTPGN
jgi:mono/diheme cytochrome c family protein